MSEHAAECARVRALLLTVDTTELRGEGRSDVARHVRVCAGCAAVAARIINGQRRIDEMLTTMSTRQQPGRRRQRSRMRLVGGGFALAAAAAIALLLMPIGPTPVPGVRTDPIARLPTSPVVNAAGAGAVAVMRTSDPMVTVIWFLQDVR